MKTKSNPLIRISSLLAAVSIALTATSYAANLTWDNGAATGNWNTTDANWTGSTWNNATPDNAVFNTNTGTINLTEAITAGSFTFGLTNANLTGAFTGSALTINGNLTAQADNNNGYGHLILSFANDVNVLGDVPINRGVLQVAGGTFTANRIGSTNAWGRLLVSGGSVTATNGVDDSVLGGGVAMSVFLEGGTLSVPYLKTTSATWTGLGADGVVLNGGTLRATANSTDFIQTWDPGGWGVRSTVGVGPNGANIDSNGFDVAIYRTLVNYGGAGTLTKNGAGKLTLNWSEHSGGTTVNAGTLEYAPGGGWSLLRNTLTVNAGATVSTLGDGTGLGWQTGSMVTTLNINGGTVTAPGTMHVWQISGGVNMTGGTLQSNGGVSNANGPQLEWINSTVNTSASADTATIGGRIRMRGDGGAAGIVFNVADGAATTDLLVSAAITEAWDPGRSITKNGAGTMVLSGANNYTGATTVNAGTLILSGNSSAATGAVTVNAGVLGLGDGTNPTNLNDEISVTIASGAQVNLNFTGTDTVGSLSIEGSGPLPAGLYNSSHPTYGSYFTGGGSLQILGASGTWTSLVDGNWGDASNWAGNTVAVGYDATATFNAASGATVTLESNRMIGNLAFSVSDYTIGGASSLTLNAAVTPSVSVATGRTAAISANVAGTRGMEKVGAGTLVFTGVKSYTGGTTVTEGTLELAGGNSGNSIIRGALTIAPGATVNITGGDGTGFGWNNPVTAFNINGGTLNAVNTAHIGFGAAATMIIENGASVQGTWHWNGDGTLGVTCRGDSTNTVSGQVVLRPDSGRGHTFNVSNGAAATDLLISANLSDQWPEVWWVPASDLIKSGAGKMVLSGTNTFDGNTTVNNGVLEVTATGSLHFRPTSNGATNVVSGSGSLSFLGTVDLDLSAVNATVGNSWTLFNLGSFSSATLSPVAVRSGLSAFTEVTPGTWELAVTGAKWVFTTADGKLAYVNAASPYATWSSTFGLSAGSESGDLDGDGLTNFQEFAFGLIPNDSSSVNPIISQVNPTTGQFSYQRLAASGLTYTIWTTTDLVTWTQDTNAVQNVTTGNPNDSVQVTLTGAPLTASKLFVRVKAE